MGDIVDFVFQGKGGAQVSDSLKVCGRKYGDLIIVITKLILNNQGDFQTKP